MSQEPAEPHHPDAELGFSLPPPTQIGARRGALYAIVGVTLLAGAFLAGFMPRHRGKVELDASNVERGQALPRVEVFSPKVITSDRALVLPGSVQALEQTTIYARATGYVHRWLVDLGDRVESGKVLAEIDTPELDAQLDQARAQLGEAQAALVKAIASRDFSKTDLARYERLTPSGIASQQQLEQRQAQAHVDEANVTVAQATVASQQANIRRLVQLKSFSHVTAPFGGTIVARSIERGALVSGTTPMFKLAATDPVRVFVQLPQDVAPSVRTGGPAQITVREYGGRVFAGIVSHSAGALDDATRTMTIEVRVPNPKNELLTGMYAQAALTLPTPHRLFEIPATALYNDSRGTEVALVGGDGKIEMRRITVERDTGSALQVSFGLDGNERIVKLASSDLSNGTHVEVLGSPPAEKK